MARGRSDDGVYISVERSNACSGFRKGFYVVVVASEREEDSSVREVLAATRKVYADCYSKLTNIHIGCNH
ncbi:MAG: hypothetical protein HYX75_04555 [Acidobacteria bacterium]|nr:hypothetical protein [Acidobacteriota bacterium]